MNLTVTLITLLLSTTRSTIACRTSEYHASDALVPGQVGFSIRLRAIACVEYADPENTSGIPEQPGSGHLTERWVVKVKADSPLQDCVDRIIEQIPGTEINDQYQIGDIKKIRLTPPNSGESAPTPTPSGADNSGNTSIQKWCSCDLSSAVLEEFDLNLRIRCGDVVGKLKIAHYEDSFQCANHLNATQSCQSSPSQNFVNICECRPASVVLETYALILSRVSCGSPAQVVQLGIFNDAIACRYQIEANPGCR